MAIMIPEIPREFNPASKEDLIFQSLKCLPDTYFVIHSMSVNMTTDGEIEEHEIDFVIFNREKGIMCVEAKAGKVFYDGQKWLYGNNEEMPHNGPYNQARTNVHSLIKYFESHGFPDITGKCKFVSAVWFPSSNKSSLLDRSLTPPPGADMKRTLTIEDLFDPLPSIERIFSYNYYTKVQTNLSENLANKIIREVICPKFNIFPAATFKRDVKNIIFHKLLKEQVHVLEFLEEQKTVVISGSAGTGKTCVAVERATRCAATGERVLFLCYNTMLRDFLDETYGHENIDFYTISKFTKDYTGTTIDNFKGLKNKLEDAYISGNFPYKHVIIDEGQDFGKDNIEDVNILKILYQVINDTVEIGSFYIFYDKLQLVQADELPEYITDADCKITLYKNCRNTENIANTSLRPVTDKPPRMMENSLPGVPTKIHFCEDADAAIAETDGTIDSILSDPDIGNFVIVTCKTEDTSILSPYASKGLYSGKFKFTTCRKFKGLEADAIILIDIDEKTFTEENVLDFYVGASRAKLRLDIITTISEDGCKDVLENFLNKKDKIKKPLRDFAKAINAVPVFPDDD